MNAFYKSALLAGAATGMLAIAGAPAQAFDSIHWNWNQTVNDHIDRYATIHVDLHPTGLVDVEKMQLFIGDVNASSDVSNIHNVQPVVGSNGNPGDDHGHDGHGHDDLVNSGSMNNIASSIDARTDLPTIASTATAVANNQSISSQVSLSVDDTQIVFGGFNSQNGMGGGHDDHHGDDHGGNNTVPSDLGTSGLSGALALVQAGSNGQIIPASISADSNVHNIDNAAVDSAATAVANNASIDVAAATPGDASLIGDFTQGAFANVGADSSVSNVSLSNYTNLAQTGNPVVSSAATAVGNNLNITVSGPTAH